MRIRLWGIYYTYTIIIIRNPPKYQLLGNSLGLYINRYKRPCLRAPKGSASGGDTIVHHKLPCDPEDQVLRLMPGTGGQALNNGFYMRAGFLFRASVGITRLDLIRLFEVSGWGFSLEAA